MRSVRFVVVASLFVLIGGMVVPALTPGTASGAAVTPCSPAITSVGEFQPQASQSVEITGSCFGTGATLNQSDNFYIDVQDRSPKMAWSGCYLEDTDGVSCTVTTWTNDEIIFSGFSGSYGGDRVLSPDAPMTK